MGWFRSRVQVLEDRDQRARDAADAAFWARVEADTALPYQAGVG